MKILIANGVNLDLLGVRQIGIYGNLTLKQIENLVLKEANKLQNCYDIKNYSIQFFQTNSESDFINNLNDKWDGFILNLGAWSHTSLAIADRLISLNLNFIEIHISNLSKREEFRQKSYISQYALGVIYGFGIDSYINGLFAMTKFLLKKNGKF